MLIRAPDRSRHRGGLCEPVKMATRLDDTALPAACATRHGTARSLPQCTETEHARRPPLCLRSRVCKQKPAKRGLFRLRCRPGAAAEGGPGGTSRARCCWLQGHRTGGFSEGMRLKWPNEIDRVKRARSLSLSRTNTHSLTHSLCRHMAHRAFRGTTSYMARIS